MNRFLVTLPALFAWLAMCLPWQVCQSDCRTAVVGGWGHDCHLPGLHGACAGHGHHSHRDPDGPDQDSDGCPVRRDNGSHSKLVIPLSEPEPGGVPGPGYDELTWPGGCACTSMGPDGLARGILARCAGPPGPAAGLLRELRSVVLLL